MKPQPWQSQRLIQNFAGLSLILCTFLLPQFGHRYIRRLLGHVGATVASTRIPGVIFCAYFLLRQLLDRRGRQHDDRGIRRAIRVVGVIGALYVVVLPVVLLEALRAAGEWVAGGGRLWVAAWCVGGLVWVGEVIIGVSGFAIMEECFGGLSWGWIGGVVVVDIGLMGLGRVVWRRLDVVGWKNVYEVMVILVGVGLLPWIVEGVEDQGDSIVGNGYVSIHGNRSDKRESNLEDARLTARKIHGMKGKRMWFNDRRTKFSLLCGVVLWTLVTISASRGIEPLLGWLRSPLPAGYRFREIVDSTTGKLAVVEKDFGSFKARFLLCDHSVIGGRFSGRDVESDSIYSQFYVPEAVRLTRNPVEEEGECSCDHDATREHDKSCENGVPIGGREGRTLVIGAGVGITAQSLHQLGSEVDLVEIDPEVLRLAQQYFGLKLPETHLFAEDALDFVSRKDPFAKSSTVTKSGTEKYDYVIHDVFTGGSVPLALFDRAFFLDLKLIMKDDAVLALNFVGNVDGSPAASGGVLAILKILKSTWRHVRFFSDEHQDANMHNYVFFASDLEERVTFRKPVKHDSLNSEMRLDALKSFEAREVKHAQNLLDKVEERNGLKENELLHAAEWVCGAAHWHVMRNLLPTQAWERLL